MNGKQAAAKPRARNRQQCSCVRTKKMPSPFLTKTIAKVQQSKQEKAKTVNSLANLCTQSLWEQSIEAGKALELVNALRKSDYGRRALAHRGDLRTRTIIVNVMGARVSECVCGHVPFTKDSEFFFALLDLCYKNTPKHPLGGYDLILEDTDDAIGWAYAVLKSTNLEDLRSYVKEYGDVTIPDLASDQDTYQHEIDWVNEETDWATELRQRFDNLFDINMFKHKRKPTMLTSNDLDKLEEMGHPVKQEAVVTLDRFYWTSMDD